jgi:sugar-specific transcriptional regulator TrmB
MSADELADRLQGLGLTRYESQAYTALVRRADSTPVEIAQAAGIPRPRVYDVMRSLVVKGVAIDRPGAVSRFSPASPHDAVQVLLAGHRRRLADAERDAAEVAAALQPAFDAGQDLRGPLDYVEVIRDVDVLRRRYAELQVLVEREMLMFNKMPAAVRIGENRAGLDLAARADLRGLYEFAFLDDPDDVAGLRRFIEAGEKARFVESLPTKLAIIDERMVMVAMVDPLAGEPQLTTMVVNNTELAVCLRVTFEHYWAQSLSLDEAIRRRRRAR